MNQVFRTKDLSSSRLAVQSPASARTTQSTHINALPFIPKPGSPALSTESVASTSVSTWGAIAKGSGANASKSIDIASKKVPARRFVLLNVNDERLDQPLPGTDPGAEARYARRMEKDGKVSVLLAWNTL